MEEKFLEKNTDEWISYLKESHDIPCEPMQFTEDLVTNKQAIENNYVIELDLGTGSKELNLVDLSLMYQPVTLT